MFVSAGLVAAFIAFFCWGFGDFFMQRSIRAIGRFEALFCITAFGAIVLLPFVRSDILIFLAEPRIWLFLLAAAIISFFSAHLQFLALERGKLAAVEPAMSLELPGTVIIGLWLLHEHLNLLQGLLIVGVFLGVVMVSLQRRKIKKHWWSHKSPRVIIEAGVLLATFGALVMAGTNVLYGLASRETSPLLTIWFVHLFLAVASFSWLVATKALHGLPRRIISQGKIILAMSIFDNLAWLAYGYAAIALPISLAIGITESYVALAAFLGLKFNHEKLTARQIFGGLTAIVCSILLAIISRI